MHDFEGSREEFLKLLAEFGEEPAFVVRARSVEHAWDAWVKRASDRYEDLLHWPRLHLAGLALRIQRDWSRLERLLLDADQANLLRDLHASWESKVQEEPGWSWTDRGALKTYVESTRRFNQSWQRFLKRGDLEAVNQCRRDYNAYYPVEKASAFGCERTAVDFEPLEMISIEEATRPFPFLVVPDLK